MKLRFSANALDDLVRLREFISAENPRAARRVSRLLTSSMRKLVTYPMIGKPVEELPECRELVVRSYVVWYRLQGKEIEVIRVWHGREDRY